LIFSIFFKKELDIEKKIIAMKELDVEKIFD
jgi:hypothetical protein